MRNQYWRKSLLYRCFNAGMIGLLAFSMIISSASVTQAQSDQTQPQTPLDTPTTFVGTGTVSDFSRISTVMDWHSSGYCYNPPKAPSANTPALGDVSESITRKSLIGASPDHILYSKDIRATNNCNPYVFSKVVFDGTFAYWVDATGLVKLSKDANLGDAPTLISASFADQLPYQIAVDSQFVYLSRDKISCTGICVISNPLMEKVDKNTGAITGLHCTVLVGCPYGINLKVDPGSRYLYYVDTAGSLEQLNLSNPSSIVKMADHVTAYFPEGRTLISCVQLFCYYNDYIFIAHGLTTAGQTHEIIRFDNDPSASVKSTTIYKSSYAYDVSINDLVVDSTEIFFYELRANAPCTGNPCFNTYSSWLYRSGKTNSTGLANIYQTAATIGSVNGFSFNLDTNGTKLFWVENGNILELSNQATALPKYPMQITGIEVTQGIQTPGNTVALINGKRTFVRVYVKSTDPNHDVSGITARLKASINGAPATDWIEPTSELSITVKRNPQRTNLNDGFLFELPWNWVTGLTLTLTAELNPNHDPEETDGYANNVLTVGPFIMNASPRLEVRLFEYYYTMGGTSFGPGVSEAFGNEDWINKAYPVSDGVGDIEDPGAGLKVSVTQITDDHLADLVRYPTLPCESKDTTSTPDPNKADCQNLRASAYAASLESSMRDGFENAYKDTDSTTYYGLIAVGSEMRDGSYQTYFPRGQDGGKNGAGPAGAKYLGWYAGHEVGHSVGLGHPATADTQCGIKGSDSLPTYPNGQIGTNNDATNSQGFLDAPTYDYPRYDNKNLALGSATMDMMAYCLPQWISDQNYTRIYQNLTGFTPLTASSTTTNGNWLSVYGGIYTNANNASIDVLQHIVGDAKVPAIVAGGYAIRLLDAAHVKLIDYSFTPSGGADSALLLYGQVVAFVPNTRFVQIVRLSDDHSLVESPISANNPSVSNVTLVNPPSPISGTVTLTWTGSHPDNLPLTYNILYSRDGGAHFIPFVTHVSGTSRDIDTYKLGGGATTFRVVASDGANTGFADSPSYTLANKAPSVAISLPASTVHVAYGQLVNFSGDGWDVQDGTLADTAFTWTYGSTILGTGRLLSQNLLPMGDNTIVLTGTNSLGLKSSAAVHVIVSDKAEPDGPSIQVTPGSVTWSVNPGVTAKQTQTLTVSNYGTGALAWAVTSDSSWLTTSVSSGVGGDTVIVSGDPANMVSGQVQTGFLSFTTTNNGITQTVKLPVSINMGDVYLSPYYAPLPGKPGVFLPIVIH